MPLLDVLGISLITWRGPPVSCQGLPISSSEVLFNLTAASEWPCSCQCCPANPHGASCLLGSLLPRGQHQSEEPPIVKCERYIIYGGQGLGPVPDLSKNFKTCLNGERGTLPINDFGLKKIKCQNFILRCISCCQWTGMVPSFPSL